MNRLIFVVISIVILFVGCKKEEKRETLINKGEQKEEWEYFAGGSYTQWLKGNESDPEGEYISYHINVDWDKEEIDVYRIDPQELATETDGRGIKFGKHIIDKTNRTISFYRKRDGALIITVKFISDNEFKIVEYGKWLDEKFAEFFKEEIDERGNKKFIQLVSDEVLNEELHFKGRFIHFKDTNRMYRMD